MSHTIEEPWIAETAGSDAYVVTKRGRRWLIGDRIYHAETSDAHARLIAAAPEMFDLLQVAEQISDHPRNCASWVFDKEQVCYRADETRCDCWLKQAQALFARIEGGAS